MKTKYAILLYVIPAMAVASGHGDPPPSGNVTTIEDVKNIIFYLSVALLIVGSVLAYLQLNLRQSIKRRARAATGVGLPGILGGETSAGTGAQSPNDVHLVKVRAEFQAARESIQEEVDKVQGRSSLNLAIGILISLAAIGILFFQLREDPLQNHSWENLFSAYFPRFIACLFIELLAFFFLRLYRGGIEEMRAYGMDLKELALKQVAVEAIWAEENPESARSKFSLSLLQSEQKKAPLVKADSEIDPQKALELIQKLASALVDKGKSKSDKKDED